MLLPSPGLDLAGLADAYAGRGWVQMPDAFDREGADRLHEVLSRFPHWELFLSDENGKPEVLNAAAIAADREGVARKMEALRRRAGSAFGYQYLGYPLIAAYTGRRHPGHPIHQVTEALNSEAFLELGRKLTGDRSIRRSDVQASFYRPGDFLNLHDDTGPGRAAAFTIGLSRGWRPDWGGQLLFHDADGDVVRGFAPRFNALTVFRVPRAHSVAPVAGYAQAPRLSVVGWWRTD